MIRLNAVLSKYKLSLLQLYLYKNKTQAPQRQMLNQVSLRNCIETKLHLHFGRPHPRNNPIRYFY
jgi:hypothetical protein